MKDYKQVDPKTITFDFTNTKIKVNNEDESKWIQEVMGNNGCEWRQNKIPYIHTHDNYDLQVEGKYIYSGWTDTQTFKEITIQDILNNMKEVIEVGDTVLADVEYVVKEIKDGKYYMESGGFLYRDQITKLVSKANKGEIVGYELLKDLPGIPAGVKSNNQNAPNWYKFSGKNNSLDVRFSEIIDTTWFKPLYEPKEVVVEISGGRSLGLKNEEIVMIGNSNLFKEAISFDQFISLYCYITAGKKQSTKIMSYQVDILTFKLGCVELTREDISKVYEVIQSIK